MKSADRFGLNLKRLRLAKGLSQEALAAKARLHRTYVGAVERGEKNIALTNIHKLAIALECSLAELVAGIHDGKANE
jgi:transcriptional regulator with XRE-family HTH domain